MGKAVKAVGWFAHFADSGVSAFGGDKLGQPRLAAGTGDDTRLIVVTKLCIDRDCPNAKGGAG